MAVMDGQRSSCRHKWKWIISCHSGEESSWKDRQQLKEAKVLDWQTWIPHDQIAQLKSYVKAPEIIWQQPRSQKHRDSRLAAQKISKGKKK